MTDAGRGGVLRWKTIQGCIAACPDCIRVEPDVVAKPLEVGEIPDPPDTVDVLFVGVAPPALKRGKDAADDAFRDRRLFLVHSCKVRPVPAELKAPPDDVIAWCARRHLAEEIVAREPRAVCFLEHNTARAAALVGLAVDDRIATAELISETAFSLKQESWDARDP